MSAVNIFCGSRRACVLTDSSFYRPDGTIVAFDLKAFPVESWTGVITGRGDVWGMAFARDLTETFGSFDEFLARSAPLIERAHRAALTQVGEGAGQTFVEIHVVGWSEQRDRPEAHVLVSPRPGAEDPPYVWRSLEGEDGVFVHALFSAGELWQLHRQGAEPDVDFTAETFDPVRHGIPVMEAQRRRGVEADISAELAGLHVIGGELWLTVVDREGVRQDVIREWRDRVGEPIRPEALDEASLPRIPPSGFPPSWPFERFDRAFRAGIIEPLLFDHDPAALARFEASAPPGAGLSRQQRRAAKAQSRKLARV